MNPLPDAASLLIADRDLDASLVEYRELAEENLLTDKPRSKACLKKMDACLGEFLDKVVNDKSISPTQYVFTQLARLRTMMTQRISTLAGKSHGEPLDGIIIQAKTKYCPRQLFECWKEELEVSVMAHDHICMALNNEISSSELDKVLGHIAEQTLECCIKPDHAWDHILTCLWIIALAHTGKLEIVNE